MTPETIAEGRRLLDQLAAPRVHGHGARGRDDTEAYVIHYAMKHLSAFLDDAEENERLRAIRVCFHCRTFVVPEDDDGDCPECTNRAEAIP